jgi:hypothetical protein
MQRLLQSYRKGNLEMKNSESRSERLRKHHAKAWKIVRERLTELFGQMAGDLAADSRNLLQAGLPYESAQATGKVVLLHELAEILDSAFIPAPKAKPAPPDPADLLKIPEPSATELVARLEDLERRERWAARASKGKWTPDATL